MKRFFLLLSLVVSGNCLAQLGNESLQIDTTALITPCDCNAAFIVNMKEEIAILEEVKRIGKEGPQMEYLTEEDMKRGLKYYELNKRCIRIYDEQGSYSTCPDFEEGDALERKLSRLRREVRAIDPNRIALGDESLEIDTSLLEEPCQCHSALMLNLEESVFILQEIKRLGKESPKTSWLNEELKKRDLKYDALSARCMSVYERAGKGNDCEHSNKEEELFKRLSALRKELEM